MEWKDFFKPTITKIIVTILLTIIAYFFILSMNVFLTPIFSIFVRFSEDFALKNIFLILFLQFIFDYLLICSFIGFFKSIRNKGYLVLSLVTLIFLILVVIAPITLQAQIQKSKSFDILTSRGFVPSLDTREKCLAKGFLWQDIGEGDGSCYNNFTKEECQSKGYYWNICAYMDTKTEQTAEGFVHNQVCVEKCIIE